MAISEAHPIVVANALSNNHDNRSLIRGPILAWQETCNLVVEMHMLRIMRIEIGLVAPTCHMYSVKEMLKLVHDTVIGDFDLLGARERSKDSIESSGQSQDIFGCIIICDFNDADTLESYGCKWIGQSLNFYLILPPSPRYENSLRIEDSVPTTSY